MKKILIVDDEQSIRDLINLTLSMESYETDLAEDGEIALKKIENEAFDLILLDVMLPKISGLELIAKIQGKNIPVIFLTAKASLNDKIFGLKLGAEDYITKPFEPLELLARIEVILRRRRREKEKETVHIDKTEYKHLEIYPDERVVKSDGIDIYLTAKEFDLLMVFIINKNIVLSRETILQKIWGYDFYGETRTVDMHVNKLREKLNLKDNLQTVYKVGYKLKE